MPSSQQIQVGLKFIADTSQAKQQIQSLQQTLQQIGNTPIGVTGGSIESAVQSAKQLEIALQKAVNVDTGKLNFSALNKSLASMGTNVTEVGNKLLSMGPQGQKAFQQLAQSISQAEIPARKLNGVLGRFADTLLRTIRWQVASTMIHGFISTVRSAVSYIEDLDKSLNSIQRITQKNDAEIANFAKTANKMAGQLSTVTKEYSNASLIFFQQGLDTAEVIERTNATIKLAKVTGDSVENISSKLTAIWNNFDDGTKSLEYYADVITKLGAATASSSDEIATGLQKFAAVADTVGLSYERATAALATVVAQTRQSAEIVGTSFKTIFARVEGLKLGETLEDDVTLNQYSAALGKIGVNILDSNNNLKDMDTILDDLGDKWNKLTEAQKVATAQTVAGVRQYSQFLALMDNYEQVRANEDLAKDSKGTLDKQFKTYQESIEALDKEIEKAKQDVFAALFNADDLKGFKEGLKDALESVQKIVSAVGGLKGIIVFVTTLLLERAIPSIQNGISNIVTYFKTLRADSESTLTSFSAMAAQQSGNASNANIKSSINNDINTTDSNYVTSQQQSMYYTSQILSLRQQLLENSQNMTEEQRKSVQLQIDYLSQIGQIATEERDQLEILKQQREEKEAILAEENRRQAYIEQNKQNKQMNESIKNDVEEKIISNKEFSEFNSMKDDDAFDAIDKYINKYAELKKEYNSMAEDAEKYSTEEIKDFNKRIKAIDNYIEKLEKAQDKMTLSKNENDIKEGREDASKVLKNSVEEEQNFRKNLNPKYISAKQAGLNAMKPDYPMSMIANDQSEESLGMATANIINNEQADLVNNVLRNISMIKEETDKIDFDNTNVEDLSQKLNVSQQSLKALATKAGQYNVISKKAVSIQKDISVNLKQQDALEKSKIKSGKVYQKTSSDIANQQRNIVKSAKKMYETMDKTSKEAEELKKAIDKADNSIGKGDSAKYFEELETTLGTTSTKATQAGTALNDFAHAIVNSTNSSETSKEALHGMIDDTQRIQQVAEQAAEAQERFNQASQGFQVPSGIQLFAQSMGTVIQATTQGVQAVQMLTSGVNMLSDAFSGNGDIVSALSGTMMILRGIMLTFNIAQSAGIGLSKLLTISRRKEIQANIAAAKAQGDLNAQRLAENILLTQKQAIQRYGAIAGVVVAAAATAGLIAMIAAASSSKKAQADAEANAQKAESAAEKAKEAAEESKEAYKEIEENYKKFKELYKSYTDTGEASSDLYESSKNLIEQLDLEGDMVLLLAGRYDLLADSIKNATLKRAEQTLQDQIDSLEATERTIYTSADAEDGGFLTEGIETGYLGLNTDKAFLWFIQQASKSPGKTFSEWLEEEYGEGIKLEGDKIYFAKNTQGYLALDKFYKDTETFNKDFLNTKVTAEGVSVVFQNQGYSSEDANKIGKMYANKGYTWKELLGKLQSSNTFETPEGVRADTDILRGVENLITSMANPLETAWQEAETNGDLEKFNNYISGFNDIVKETLNQFAKKSDIDSINSVNELNELLNNTFDKDGRLQQGNLLFDTLASIIIKDFNPEDAGQVKQVQDFIQKYFPDLENQLREKSNLSAAITVQKEMQNLYTRRHKTEEDVEESANKINFDEIAEQANMTIEEIQNLFDSGKIDLTTINWSLDADTIISKIVNVVERAQETVDEQPIEVKFTMAQDALKNWKKSMSYADYTSWIETNKDLFGENGIIKDLSLEEFLKKSYEEQQKILSTALTTENVATWYQEQAEKYGNYAKDFDKYWEDKGITKEIQFFNLFDEALKEAGLENVKIFTKDSNGNYNRDDEVTVNKIGTEYKFDETWIQNEAKIQGNEKYLKLIDQNGFEKIVAFDSEEERNKFIEAYLGAQNSITKEEEGVKIQANAFEEGATYASTLAPKIAFDQSISNFGLDTDEVYDYLDYLQSINSELKDNLELARKITIAVKAQEKGFKDASDHLEDYLAILEQGDKTTAEYAKQLNLFQEDLSLLFNREDLDNSIAQTIFDDTIAMDLFKQAIEGSDEAWQQFQVRAAMLELGIKDFDTSPIDEALTELASQDIEIGATVNLNNVPYMQKLNKLLEKSELNIDQIQAMFDDLGYEPEIKYVRVELPQINWETGEKKHSLFTWVPQITSARKISLSHPASLLSSKDDKGSDKGSKKELKNAEDEIERYHRLNKTLDSLSKQYSRVSSAKDAAFGAQRLKYIEQENKLLQQQYNTEKALLKEIEQNYSKDRSAIEAYGAIIDQNGVITNYDQIMKKQLDKLNSAYAKYNAGGLSDEIIEAREKEYEEFKKVLSQFEETNSTYLDQLEKVEEAIRKQITNALEGIKAKVELELELPNQQLKMIEYKLQDLENRAFSSSEKIALWGQQVEIAADSFNHYADAFRNVLTMSVYDANGNKTGGFGLTADQANRLMSGDAGVLDEAGITGENAQEIMEALKEYQDNLLEEYSKVREARQSIEEELLNQLNEYTEAIDQQISKLEKLNSIANNYKTLINTAGKELLGISADIMNSINATIMNTSKNQMAVLKTEQDALESNLAEAREKLANALASGDGEAIQYWKNVNQEIENTLLETKDTLLSTINDFIESATEILQERIKESFDNFAKQIYGMTFEDAQASYDRYKTLSDDYLKDYQKIYELSKLTRQVEQSIDDTNNIKSKQILRDLQAEINEYQAEGVQMTQYEVDYLNKKYELRKAEIALEEAQNAKDQVRLSRNADGGWGYVYTANQQNIDKAQQTYEDKLYALQELNTKAIEDTQATILQLQTEYQNAIMEIWENKELSPEEISARVNELTDYYTRLIDTQSKTLDSALGNNNELYTEDWKNYNKLTGYRISADENYIDKFEETWLGKQQQGIMSALDFFELYKNTIGTYDDGNSILGQCYSAFEDYSSMVRDSLSSAGLDLEEFAFVVSNEMDKIEESSREAKDEGENLANLLSETLPNTMDEVESVQKKTTNMFNNMKLAIEGVNNALILLIQKLQEYNGTTITEKTFTPPEGVGDSNNGDNGDNGNNGNNDEGKTKKYYILKKHPKEGFMWLGPYEHEENFFDKDYYKKDNTVVAYATLAERNAGYLHYTFSAADNSDLANEIILWLQKDRDKQYIAYDTGGYTGAFGPEGRLAMLHEKELVLNKQDTSNMLKMIDIARQVIYDFNSSLPNFTAQTLSNALFNRSNGETNQNITIEAHFPNAVNHLEIEEAFRNLANYSAQNAYNLDLSQNINIF